LDVRQSTKYGLKKGFREEFLVLKSRFLVKKKVHIRVMYVKYQISGSRDRQKTDKIESMTKKVIRNFGR